MQRILCILSISIISIFKTYSQIPTENLMLWVSADSVEIIDGKVAIMYDLSGNNSHAQQANSANRPIFKDIGLNNLPVLSFTGNQFLKAQYPTSLSQPITSFAVWKTTQSANVVCYCNYSSSLFDLQSYSNGIQIYTSSGIGYSKPCPFDFILSTAIYNGSSSKIFENGILKASGNVGSSSMNGITIGATYSNTWLLRGEIAELIFYNRLLSEQERSLVENYLMDKYTPEFTLGPDIYVNYGFCDTTISIPNGFTNFQWSTGETTQSISVNQSGQYWASAIDYFGRTHYDTINVFFPTINIENSYLICAGDSVLINPGLTGTYFYEWSDGSTDSENYLKDAGSYWIRIEDTNSCFDTVFFEIQVDNFKNLISLGNDTALCSGNKIRLIQGEDLCTSFLWESNGNTLPEQVVYESGWQKLTVTNENNCIAVDSIFVTIVGTAPVPDYLAENLCFGNNTLFFDNSTTTEEIILWKWIINQQDTIIGQNIEWQFESTGIQNIEFFVQGESGCSNSIDFNIEVLPIPDVSFTTYPACTGIELEFVPEILLPQNTEISSFSWKINNIEYSNEELFSFLFSQENNFNVSFTVFLNNSCHASYDSIITVLSNYPLPQYFTSISPFNGNNIWQLPQEINFTWSNPPEALFYKLYIAKNQNFEEILFNSDFLTDNYFNFSVQEDFDTLWWKVIAYNPCFQEVESDIKYIKFFAPSELSNLALWLSADSVEIIDGKVAIMYDLSGNNSHAQQANSANRPIFKDIGLNNLPVLSFTGNQFLKAQYPTSLSQPITSFAVWKTTQSANVVCYCNYSSSLFDLQSYSNGIQIYTSSGIGYSKPCPFDFILSTAIYNGSSSKIFENGILKASGNVGSSSMNGITIGATYSNTWLLRGEIAELIFYDTVLNDSLRNLVENYLRNKYFPPVNLGYDIRIPYGFCDTAITTAYKPWYVAYQWSTGETDSIIHVNKPGVYSVTVTDIFGFQSSDDIRVYYPVVNQLSDTVVCYGQPIIWDLGLTGAYFYEWIGLPETSHTVVIENQGEYAAILTDSLGCKFYTDTISLNFDYYELTASVGPADTLLCSGNRLMLVTNRDETVNYLWNTGSQEPEIVLTESGTYSVTVTNQRGCIAIDEINVTITGTVPVPDFSYSGQCKSNPMLLNDLSQSEQGNIISWEWKINDEIFSTEENPILPGTYLSSNNLENSQYYIELTVLTDAGCSDFTGKLIDVYALPKAEYAADFLCQHSETRFRSLSQVQNANIIQNIWSIENLNLEGDEVFTSFTESGWKNIKLISTSDKNCKDSIIGKVFIKEAELPVFEWQNACAGEPVYFINRTPVNIVNMPERYLWNFGDGNTAESSSPVNIYNEAGTKTVSLEITYQNRCTARSETEISIYENPEISLSEFHSCVNKNFIPQVEIISNDGEIQSYLWNLSHDGYTILTSSLAQPEFMIQDTGQYLLKLTVKTENQCKAEATSNLTVHKNPEVSMLISDIWGAVPLSVDIIGIGEDVNDFEWKIGEEILYGQELNYVFTEAGTYNIILTGISEYGCTNQDLKMVKVVIPIMDIQLYNLNLKVENNYLKTSVYVINSGTLPCENAPIILNLGEARIFREIIPYLAPSKVLKYDFSMQVYVPDGEVPDPVCVEIEVHPYFGFADINPENNILCHTETESLKVFAPYPNPAKDVLICEYINILSSSTKFELFNNVGERVYIQEFNSPSIYNKVELNVSEFFSGIYYLKVSNEQNYKYFKVVVG